MVMISDYFVSTQESANCTLHGNALEMLWKSSLLTGGLIKVVCDEQYKKS